MMDLLSKRATCEMCEKGGVFCIVLYEKFYSDASSERTILSSGSRSMNVCEDMSCIEKIFQTHSEYGQGAKQSEMHSFLMYRFDTHEERACDRRDYDGETWPPYRQLRALLLNE